MLKLQATLIEWQPIIGLWLITKLILLIVGLYASQNPHWWMSWIQWDGPHYIDIAKYGYETSGEHALWIVFYPLYPLLVKIYSLFLNSYELAIILVSWVNSLVAAIALYEITKQLFNPKIALKAVWWLLIFPTSFFLQASYTEATYLATSLVCLSLYLKQKMVPSWIAAYLTGLTRINGLTLIPLFLLTPSKIKDRIIISSGIVSGFFTYLLINYWLFGDWLHFQQPLLSNWYKKFDYPWNGVISAWQNAPNLFDLNNYVFTCEIYALAFIFLMLIPIWKYTNLAFFSYTLINLLLFTSTSFIASTPRYALILFPIMICLAQIKNKYFFTLLSIISIGLLIPLTIMYTTGQWAF